MIKSIILDYGGTLDTNGDHWSHVIQKAYQTAGVLVDAAMFREAYVYGEQELERSLEILPHHNFSDLMQIKIRIQLQYLAMQQHFPPAQIEPKSREIADYCYTTAKSQTAAAIPVLEKLSKDYSMYLVSNFYGNLNAVLKDFGIYKYFRKVIESAKVGVRKPDTAIFELAVKETSNQPSEILVVGDSYENDIKPALKLGLKTLWLKGESWEEEKEITENIPTIKSLEECLSFLEGI